MCGIETTFKVDIEASFKVGEEIRLGSSRRTYGTSGWMVPLGIAPGTIADLGLRGTG